MLPHPIRSPGAPRVVPIRQAPSTTFASRPRHLPLLVAAAVKSGEARLALANCSSLPDFARTIHRHRRAVTPDVALSVGLRRLSRLLAHQQTQQKGQQRQQQLQPTASTAAVAQQLIRLASQGATQGASPRSLAQGACALSRLGSQGIANTRPTLQALCRALSPQQLAECGARELADLLVEVDVQLVGAGWVACVAEAATAQEPGRLEKAQYGSHGIAWALQELVALAQGLAAARHYDADWMDAAATAALPRMSELSGAQLATLLWAFAHLFHPHAELLAAAADAASDEQLLQQLPPGSLAALAWSLAVLLTGVHGGLTPAASAATKAHGTGGLGSSSSSSSSDGGGGGGAVPPQQAWQPQQQVAAEPLRTRVVVALQQLLACAADRHAPTVFTVLQLMQLHQSSHILEAAGIPPWVAGGGGGRAATELQRAAAEAWHASVEQQLQEQPSLLHKQVAQALAATGRTPALHYPSNAHGSRTIDIALPELRIAVEVDGPSHFTVSGAGGAGGRHALGATRARDWDLRAAGWRVVSVPCGAWDAAEGDKQVSTALLEALMLQALASGA